MSVEEKTPITSYDSAAHYGSVGVGGGRVPNDETAAIQPSLSFHEVGYQVPQQCYRRTKVILDSCRRAISSS